MKVAQYPNYMNAGWSLPARPAVLARPCWNGFSEPGLGSRPWTGTVLI